MLLCNCELILYLMGLCTNVSVNITGYDGIICYCDHKLNWIQWKLCVNLIVSLRIRNE